MDQSIKPPKKKEEKKPGQAESTEGKRPSDQDVAGRDAPKDESGRPSREEVISTWRAPVTNQDEQEKITNTDDDVPVQNP